MLIHFRALLVVGDTDRGECVKALYLVNDTSYFLAYCAHVSSNMRLCGPT